jgi:hypothetical protein
MGSTLLENWNPVKYFQSVNQRRRRPATYELDQEMLLKKGSTSILVQ